MIGPDEQQEGAVEATPARKAQAIEQGQGPRAPWLASAAGGLLALTVLAAAAAPMTWWGVEWLRGALREPMRADTSLEWSTALWPALLAPIAVLASVVGGHLLAHGAWIRLGAWRPSRRAPLRARVSAVAAGWMLSGAAIAGGVLAALPWLAALPEMGARPFAGGLWALASFAATVTLGALAATIACGLVQKRMAQRAFDRALRMSHAEARDLARRDGAVRRRSPHASRWRLA